MRIYTKTGDEGDTVLWGGRRVPKDHARIEAYGAIDELNAALGMARTEPLDSDVQAVLDRLQQELFVVGAELAAPDPIAAPPLRIDDRRIADLEDDIDRFDRRLPPLHNFVLPCGVRAAAALHVARTVCRRAERRVVTLSAAPDQHVSACLLRYLNRLGDLLFVLARYANARAGIPDSPWPANPNNPPPPEPA